MILDRWPVFLQEITEFQKISDAEQPEFDGLTQAVNDMHKEFSVFTATEYGIKRLESVYKVVPAAGQSLEDRRAALLTRILSQLPYSYRRIKEIVDGVTGMECRIDVDYAEYSFTVNILDGSISQTVLEMLTDRIDVIRPANMVYIIAKENGYRSVIYAGSAMQIGKTLMIRQVN